MADPIFVLNEVPAGEAMIVDDDDLTIVDPQTGKPRFRLVDGEIIDLTIKPVTEENHATSDPSAN